MDTDEAIRQRFDRRRPDPDVDTAWDTFERRRTVDRQTRRSRRLGLAAAVLVVVAGAVGVVAVALAGDDVPPPVSTGPSTTTAPPAVPAHEPDTWRRLPSGPLSARSGASAVWTGTEMIVVGGTDAPPCPPNARCVGPDPDDLLADGAAYDPAADTWRTIAPAPVAVDHAPVWWTGDEMLVITSTGSPRLLAYDPVADRWHERAKPPATPVAWPVPAWNGEIAAFASGDDALGEPDRIYDVATDRWSELPADPLGCDYDRSIVATADSLVLFGVPCPDARDDAAGPRLYQAARFDLATGAWRRIVDSGIAGGSPCWVLSGDLIVNPTPGTVDGGVVDPYDRPYPTGGVLHLGSETWSPLAAPASDPDPGAPQPPASADTGYLGPAGAWVAAGTRLYEPISGAWHTISPGPEVAGDRAAVWTGSEIIAWGGTDEAYEHNVATGVAYTPPAAPPTE